MSCSTAAQSETAIEHQTKLCQAYAEAKGWSVTRCSVDDGCSGLSASRPGLDPMLAVAKRTSPPFRE
ncbi:recombinase family protein [Pararhizobium sp. BT-229]|uniref:recombinase family protein n=1 Tax=Pararhizobium sp. BT-229 TaxID=2986923 RepID=UPI003556EA25